jgi:lysozyme
MAEEFSINSGPLKNVVIGLTYRPEIDRVALEKYEDAIDAINKTTSQLGLNISSAGRPTSELIQELMKVGKASSNLDKMATSALAGSVAMENAAKSAAKAKKELMEMVGRKVTESIGNGMGYITNLFMGQERAFLDWQRVAHLNGTTMRTMKNEYIAAGQAIGMSYENVGSALAKFQEESMTTVDKGLIPLAGKMEKVFGISVGQSVEEITKRQYKYGATVEGVNAAMSQLMVTQAAVGVSTSEMMSTLDTYGPAILNMYRYGQSAGQSFENQLIKSKAAFKKMGVDFTMVGDTIKAALAPEESDVEKYAKIAALTGQSLDTVFERAQKSPEEAAKMMLEYNVKINDQFMQGGKFLAKSGVMAGNQIAQSMSTNINDVINVDRLKRQGKDPVKEFQKNLDIQSATEEANRKAGLKNLDSGYKNVMENLTEQMEQLKNTWRNFMNDTFGKMAVSAFGWVNATLSKLMGILSDPVVAAFATSMAPIALLVSAIGALGLVIGKGLIFFSRAKEAMASVFGIGKTSAMKAAEVVAAKSAAKGVTAVTEVANLGKTAGVVENVAAVGGKGIMKSEGIFARLFGGIGKLTGKALGKVLSKIPIIGGVVEAAFAVYDFIQMKKAGVSTGTALVSALVGSQKGGLGGAFSGAMRGAAIGGLVGTLFGPGPGTLIGALIGGLLFGGLGFIGGENLSAAITKAKSMFVGAGGVEAITEIVGDLKDIWGTIKESFSGLGIAFSEITSALGFKGTGGDALKWMLGMGITQFVFQIKAFGAILKGVFKAIGIAITVILTPFKILANSINGIITMFTKISDALSTINLSSPKSWMKAAKAVSSIMRETGAAVTEKNYDTVLGTASSVKKIIGSGNNAYSSNTSPVTKASVKEDRDISAATLATSGMPVTKANITAMSSARAGGTPTANAPASTGGDNKEFRDMIIRHEGMRTKPYKDSRGLPTIGIGHLIKPGEDFSNGLTTDQVYQLFNNDLGHHLNMAKQYPAWGSMDPVRKAAIADMTFNMGMFWKNSWKTLTKQMVAKDYSAAADNIRHTPYAQQVGNRALEVANMIETGKGTALMAARGYVSSTMPERITVGDGGQSELIAPVRAVLANARQTSIDTIQYLLKRIAVPTVDRTLTSVRSASDNIAANQLRAQQITNKHLEHSVSLLEKIANNTNRTTTSSGLQRYAERKVSQTVSGLSGGPDSALNIGL